jgi:hypothetical protein
MEFFCPRPDARVLVGRNHHRRRMPLGNCACEFKRLSPKVFRNLAPPRPLRVVAIMRFQSAGVFAGFVTLDSGSTYPLTPAQAVGTPQYTASPATPPIRNWAKSGSPVSATPATTPIPDARKTWLAPSRRGCSKAFAAATTPYCHRLRSRGSVAFAASRRGDRTGPSEKCLSTAQRIYQELEAGAPVLHQ